MKEKNTILLHILLTRANNGDLNKGVGILMQGKRGRATFSTFVPPLFGR